MILIELLLDEEIQWRIWRGYLYLLLSCGTGWHLLFSRVRKGRPRGLCDYFRAVAQRWQTIPPPQDPWSQAKIERCAVCGNIQEDLSYSARYLSTGM